MRIVGRSLQLLALGLLPIGVVMELSGGLGRSFGLADLLILLIFGIAAFALGRLLEGLATR